MSISKNKNGSYIGYTTITLSCLIYHLSENSIIKQHLIIKDNNSINQLTSSNVMKILTDNTIIIYIKTIIKTITNPRSNMHKKIAFDTGTNILDVSNN